MHILPVSCVMSDVGIAPALIKPSEMALMGSWATILDGTLMAVQRGAYGTMLVGITLYRSLWRSATLTWHYCHVSFIFDTDPP
jgi:hypothetical protein